MAADASFAEGGEQALVLLAEGAGDVPVLSALVQDALFLAGDARWDRKARRFAMLINRFRWEDRAAAEAAKRPYERVRSLLVISDVGRAATQGLDRLPADMVLSILSLTWEETADGAGHLLITLAGDGAIRLEAECVNMVLKDVTKPYLAPSGMAPTHPE